MSEGLQILETNLFGVIHGLNTFFSVIQEAAKSKPTSIIITGSKQGITNPPGNAAYNASKSAVKTLAEHLSWDLKGTNTSVHLLVPGWTFTGMVSPIVIVFFFLSFLSFLLKKSGVKGPKDHTTPLLLNACPRKVRADSLTCIII